MVTPIDEVSAFISETVYARPHELDAITLIIAATHVHKEVTTFPRLLVTGQSNTGKTTVLRLAKHLAFNVEDCSGATIPGLRAAFNDNRDNGLSVVVDEVDVIFGPSGMRGSASQLRTIACRGYESEATIRFAASQSSAIVPIYAPMFMAGIGEHCVPNDLLTRCVHVSMTAKPDSARKLNPGAPSWRAEARYLAEPLHAYMRKMAREVSRRFPAYDALHPRLTSRTGEIWGVLFTVADILGDTWPARIRNAFEQLATDGGGSPIDRQPRQVQLLLAMAEIFRAHGEDYLPVRTLSDELCARSAAYRALAGKRLYTLMSTATGVRADRKHIPGSDNETVVVRYASDAVPAADKILAELYPPDEQTEDQDMELG